MRAVVITRAGGPEVLEVQERPLPTVARGEVRVRVRATAVNRADLLQRLGLYPAPSDVPADIPGLEFAGEISLVGEGVDGWKVGDRVFGLVGGGSYAEELVVHGRALARMPDKLSFIDAAAIPEAFITAYDAMVTQSGLGAGELVLVNAVGSGVGTAAVQIAHAIGARSIGTARTAEKLTRARQLGLHVGVLSRDGKFADEVLSASSGRGVDVIVELVGGAYLTEDVACAANGARVVVVGLLAGARADLDLRSVLQKRLSIRGTVLRSRPLEEKIAVMQTFARQVVPLVNKGALRAVVDRTYLLAEAAEAHAHMASNEGFGKLVLVC